MDYATLAQEVKGELSSQDLKHWVEKILDLYLPEHYFNQIEADSRRKFDIQNRICGNKDNAYLILLTVDMVKQTAMTHLIMRRNQELVKQRRIKNVEVPRV